MINKRKVIVGAIYHHFKDLDYKVIHIGFDSENIDRKLVIYQSITNKKIWVRDFNSFLDKVDKSKYPNIKQTYRFELIEK
jgi:hypothetical protein